MKFLICCVVFLFVFVLFVVFVVLGFCECIQSDILQRIINNGVFESSFMLSIVFNDQVDQFDFQVVGYCVNDMYKIFYICIISGNVFVFVQFSQDGVFVELQ